MVVDDDLFHDMANIPHSARFHLQVARVQMVSVRTLYFGRETVLSFAVKQGLVWEVLNSRNLYFVARHVPHH
jgi:hypothetical protein